MSEDLRKDSPSVCLISDDFLPAATGVGTHVQCIAEGLALRGVRVIVVTSRHRGQPREEIWKGVRIYRIFSVKILGFYQALASKKNLRKIFLENEVSLVHLHYFSFLLKTAAALSSEMKLPMIYTYHMTADHLTQLWPMRPFRSLIARQIVHLCNSFDLIISPSEKLSIVIKESGVSTPLEVLTNPVVFETNRHPVEIAPSEILLDSMQTFRVFFAGRLSPEKNISLLLRAFSQVCKIIPNSTLWIAGRGPCEKSLREESEKLQIARQVQFLGFLEHKNLANYYASCDVFVLPSLIETQGLVAMEAGAFGKPIIVTDQIISCHELVEDKVSGFIVNGFSPEDLGLRLLDLALNPALRAKMGLAAKKRTEAYQPALVLDSLQKIYKKFSQDI
jgi:1,2-diacylglycerol 3-alpha-glucosyltransferase